MCLMYNMPNNQSQKKSQSQSQSRSQSRSQSKNGGRGRKKRTMKKDRRVKKSRKVMMRGGANISNETTFEQFFSGKDNLKQELLAAFPGKTMNTLFLEMKAGYKNFDTKQFLTKDELANASEELKAHLNS